MRQRDTTSETQKKFDFMKYVFLKFDVDIDTFIVFRGASNVSRDVIRNIVRLLRPWGAKCDICMENYIPQFWLYQVESCWIWKYNMCVMICWRFKRIDKRLVFLKFFCTFGMRFRCRPKRNDMYLYSIEKHRIYLNIWVQHCINIIWKYMIDK